MVYVVKDGETPKLVWWQSGDKVNSWLNARVPISKQDDPYKLR